MNALASQVGLSRSRFYDLFQISTGRSPRAYLDMLCIASAISKLSSGRGRIADVSAELGFSALRGGLFASLPFLLAGIADVAGGWLTDRLARHSLRTARCGNSTR